MIGFHFQQPVNDWPEAVAKLPPGTPIKAIDNVQLLAEAKAHNPAVFTILRHHYDSGQQFDGGYDGNVKRAREFFATFIDGTFDNYAHQVDAVEGFNEYYANSQSAEEKAAILDWVTAVNDVWTNEYRSQTKYNHIRLITANTAIGNDIPLETARVVYQHDGILGYHPYIAIDSNGGIHDGDWAYYSGRWTVMDAMYLQNGVAVDWIFTEGGPIERTPSGHLDPQNGWRHPNVFNGDVERYIDSCRYFAAQMYQWNVVHSGRALGLTLFNSGNTSVWQHFETKQPEMNAIAESMKAFYDDLPDPPPDPDPDPDPPNDSGVARVPYDRVVNVAPADTTLNDWLRICTVAYDKRQSVGFSYDDAGVGSGLKSKTAILYNIPADKRQEFDAWYWEHYIDVTLEYRELSSEGLIIENMVDVLPVHESKTYKIRALNDVTGIAIHHSATGADTSITAIAEYHVYSNDWPGIAYHYCIDFLGQIYQTNELETISYHVGNLNKEMVGICLIGNFTDEPPTEAQLHACKMLISELKSSIGGGLLVQGHRDVSQTACPGDTFDQWVGQIV